MSWLIGMGELKVHIDSHSKFHIMTQYVIDHEIIKTNIKIVILELLTMQKSQMEFIIIYFHYHVIIQLFLDH